MSDGQFLIKSFDGVLKSFTTGSDYKDKPPKGPPERLPTLTNEELAELQLAVYGENLTTEAYSYKKIELIEKPEPIEISLPTAKDLKEINVCGIDGSNQRVERASFYLLLARATIVEFRYSTNDSKPYFYTRKKDTSGVVWVDGNVFTDEISLVTTDLPHSTGKSVDVLRHLNELPQQPFLMRYNPDTENKSPSSHALGWAVKLQQALELMCIKEVPTDIQAVCIKDGPLFSTSVSPQDTLEGLNPIFSWKDQILIACSKRVRDSRLLVEVLLKNIALRKYWFKDQNINDSTLKAMATDSLLLPRILKPGHRTPLMEAIPVARQQIVEMSPELSPLACYYYSRQRPHTYIRIEVPKFMWDKKRKQVEEAIRIVAWQHELGHEAPLVQLAADQRCQLQTEKEILEQAISAALFKNNLDFPQEY